MFQQGRHFSFQVCNLCSDCILYDSSFLSPTLFEIVLNSVNSFCCWKFGQFLFRHLKQNIRKFIQCYVHKCNNIHVMLIVNLCWYRIIIKHWLSRYLFTKYTLSCLTFITSIHSSTWIKTQNKQIWSATTCDVKLLYKKCNNKYTCTYKYGTKIIRNANNKYFERYNYNNYVQCYMYSNNNYHKRREIQLIGKRSMLTKPNW